MPLRNIPPRAIDRIGRVLRRGEHHPGADRFHGPQRLTVAGRLYPTADCNTTARAERVAMSGKPVHRINRTRGAQISYPDLMREQGSQQRSPF